MFVSSSCGGSSQAWCFVIWIDVNQFLRLSCIPFSLGRTRMIISARQLAVCPQPAASWDKAITQWYCDAERQLTPTQYTLAAAFSYYLPGRSFVVQPSEGALCGAAWWFYCWSGKRHSMATEVWHVCLSVPLMFNDLYCRVYFCWACSHVNPVVLFAQRVLCQQQ